MQSGRHWSCSRARVSLQRYRSCFSVPEALPPTFSLSFRPDSDDIFVTGLRVFATARSRDTVADLNDLGIETLSLEVDKPDSIKRCREALEARTGGGLDFLINNAGRSTRATRNQNQITGLQY